MLPSMSQLKQLHTWLRQVQTRSNLAIKDIHKDLPLPSLPFLLSICLHQSMLKRFTATLQLS
jgi:hypothetical protein